MSFIDKIEDEDVKMNFIRAMKTVCEKKIYLEVKDTLIGHRYEESHFSSYC